MERRRNGAVAVAQVACLAILEHRLKAAGLVTAVVAVVRDEALLAAILLRRAAETVVLLGVFELLALAQPLVQMAPRVLPEPLAIATLSPGAPVAVAVVVALERAELVALVALVALAAVVAAEAVAEQTREATAAQAATASFKSSPTSKLCHRSIAAPISTRSPLIQLI
jgi:hypothetical protein